jgi:hypothetical protein
MVQVMRAPTLEIIPLTYLRMQSTINLMIKQFTWICSHGQLYIFFRGNTSHLSYLHPFEVGLVQCKR